jgi:hypothetical protein
MRLLEHDGQLRQAWLHQVAAICPDWLQMFKFSGSPNVAQGHMKKKRDVDSKRIYIRLNNN